MPQTRYAIDIAPLGALADPRAIVRLASAAEESGWDGLSIWDSLGLAMGTSAADPFVALAAVAAATRRLRLITSIISVARRRPQLVVQAAGTLDVLSEGRLILGVGAGEDRPDFEAFGEAHERGQRIARMDEAMAIIDAGLRGEPLTYDGRHFRASGVTLGPRPRQEPRPPMWLGALRRGGVRKAARWDGWIAVAMSEDGASMEMTPDGFADLVALVRGERRRWGGRIVRSKSPCWAWMGWTTGKPLPTPTPEPRGGWNRCRRCAAASTSWKRSSAGARRTRGGRVDLNVAIEAFSRVLPVLLLFALGAVFRRQGFLTSSTIDGLRKLVLNVTLPAALFLAFLNTQLEPQYAVIIISVFGACLVVLMAGPFLRRGAGVRSETMPSLMAGFEAGMIGYALYAAIFGQAELYRFAIVDLGQVVFVFFVLAPVVMRWASGHAPPLSETLTTFVRTPVIIAIVAGVAGSLLGLGDTLLANPIGEAGLTTVGMLAAVTTPLIAIVLGYSTSLSAGSLRDPVRTLAVRLPIWVGLALVFNVVVIEGLLGLDRLFGAAVMVMAILPPPFVVPLYMARARGRDVSDDPDHDYLVNTLSLATIVTLVAVTVVGVVYAT